MAKKPDRRVRFAFAGAVLLATVLCVGSLVKTLAAQLLDWRAAVHERADHYGLAAVELERALEWRSDDAMRWKRLGDAYLRMAYILRNRERSLDAAKKARRNLQQAFRLNPKDARIAHAAAKAEMAVYRIHKQRTPDVSPSSLEVIRLIEEAVRLRPNGVAYLFTRAVYLHECGRLQALAPAVERLACTYPPVYHHIKKSPFWSSETRDASRKGLEAALDRGISPRHAHMALASLLEDEGKMTEALAHYRTGLTFRTFENNAVNDLRLGRLYLLNRQETLAAEHIRHGLSRSPKPEEHLRWVFGWYKRAGALDAFSHLLEGVNIRGIREGPVLVFRARALIEIGALDQAERLLAELAKKEREPEAYYWLARAAEKKKDWHRMELAAQKAAFLDPATSKYHLMFAKALVRRNALEEAENAAKRALETSEQANPWLFNQRAWIRWRRKDFQGAVRDWRRAIRIRPDVAGFYAHAGAGYARMDMLTQAETYYHKALALDPENADYRKRLMDIRKRLDGRS